MGLETAFGDSVLTTRIDNAINWGRKWSFFLYPFITACCGMEFMSAACSHYDLDRFGAAFPRFTPRQSDLMLVVGTVSHKLAPMMRLVWEQMCEPKWCISVGACASTGGFYDNYATVMGIDTVIPVDVYVAGCPPRPEAILDSIMLLQDKVSRESVLRPT